MRATATRIKWRRIGLVFTLIFVAPVLLPGATSTTAEVDVKDGVRIRAFIDGKDYLQLKGAELWYEHYMYSLPGRWNDPVKRVSHNEPTYVNGAAWLPEWEGRNSKPHRLTGAALPSAKNERIHLAIVAARGTVTVAETPKPENDFTLSIQLNDGRQLGAAWYEFVVQWGAPETWITPPGVTKDEANKYRKDLQAFFDEMDKTYPFFDLKNIRGEWAKAKQELTVRVEKCESDEAFMGLVIDALKCLRDSHMGINETKVKITWPKPECYPAISFLPAQDKGVVIMHPPPGKESLLPRGAVVKTIDGVDARQFLDARGKAVWEEGGHPSPQRARLFAYRIPLRGVMGTKHTLVLVRAGKKQSVTLECLVSASGWPHTYNLPSDMQRVGRSFSYTMLPSGVGYMYLRRVDASITEGIKKAREAHPKAKGWIADLRGNGGGGYDRVLIDLVKSMPKPVAVIVDAGCVSAGETLARDFRSYAGARLFGSKTAGSSSSKRSWRFPSGIATLTIPTRSRWRGDRKPIEFNGIDPDEIIEASPEDVSQGKNTAILRAEQYVLKHD